jgi:hypothetical protein
MNLAEQMRRVMPHTDLTRLINSIGKTIFVRYFREFADLRLSNQDVVAILPHEYTVKARNTRTSKARRIFRENLQEAALELILRSERIDPETANHARKLLIEIRSRAK